MAGFTIVELKQGSPEWLEWRHNGIGGSDAAAVMGENPWKSARALRREKTAPPRESRKNAAMIRGTRLEPQARANYEARKGARTHRVPCND